MAVIAFTYKTYYPGGPLDSFRGRWDDEKDAKAALKGDRYEHEYLEIMDLETLGWTYYKWLPLYEFRDAWVGTERKCYLKHRWDESRPEFEIVWDGDVRRYGHDNVFYDAGEWSSE